MTIRDIPALLAAVGALCGIAAVLWLGPLLLLSVGQTSATVVWTTLYTVVCSFTFWSIRRWRRQQRL